MSRERAPRGGDRLPSGAAGLGRLALLPDADGQRALEQVKSYSSTNPGKIWQKDLHVNSGKDCFITRVGEYLRYSI